MKIINTLLFSLLAGSISAQVGIGTTSPDVALDIEAAGAAIDINNTSTDPLIHFQVSGTTNFTIGTDVTDSKFKIGTTALETGTAITVHSDGDIQFDNYSTGYSKFDGSGNISSATDLIYDKGTSISAMLSLKVEDEELIRRLLSRGESSGRADDQDESIIANRINEYNNKTAPLKEYYSAQNKLSEIEGNGTVEDIAEKLNDVIDTL